MHAVVLTFPGHFFQTKLSVASILAHYPEVNKITFVLDDVEADPWSRFSQDVETYIACHVPVTTDIIRVVDIKHIRDCVAGWWRQQLVKLTLDQLLDDSEWFVVDGDVIFATRCEVRHQVPISRRGDHVSNWSRMAVNYVRDLLGTGPGYLTHDQDRVITSAVPFRYLDRETLAGLRQHVGDRFHGDFVELHFKWFQDQTIVADIDPPTRWVMTEWELIEGYRREIMGIAWPMTEVGSGYPIDVDIRDKQNGKNLFRHSYRRDSEIGPDWFRESGIDIDPDVWQQSLAWYNYREQNLRA